jgi:hypothetical protein
MEARPTAENPTVERREASVPRHGTRRASLARIKSRLASATTDIVRLSALRPPLTSGWTRKGKTKPGRNNASREREVLRGANRGAGCLTS